MKKIKFILVSISVLLIMILGTVSEANAKQLNMANKDLKLPNLTNSKTVIAINNHTYSYYGVNFLMSKSNVIKKWGAPKLTKSGKNLRTSYIYGKNNNVILNYQYNNSRVSMINIKDNSTKYEYSKIYPLYDKDFKTVTRNGKKYFGNEYMNITFEKIKGKYYATEFLYLSYTNDLE